MNWRRTEIPVRDRSAAVCCPPGILGGFWHRNWIDRPRVFNLPITRTVSESQERRRNPVQSLRIRGTRTLGFIRGRSHRSRS